MTHYTTERWNGLANYRCALCPFSTLRLARMEAHVASRHPGGMTAVRAVSPAESASHDSPALPEREDEEEES